MLQKSLKQDEIDIKNKQKDLNTTKGKFEAMSKSYQDAIKNLEVIIFHLVLLLIKLNFSLHFEFISSRSQSNEDEVKSKE